MSDGQLGKVLESAVEYGLAQEKCWQSAGAVGDSIERLIGARNRGEVNAYDKELRK